MKLCCFSLTTAVGDLMPLPDALLWTVLSGISIVASPDPLGGPPDRTSGICWKPLWLLPRRELRFDMVDNKRIDTNSQKCKEGV